MRLPSLRERRSMTSPGKDEAIRQTVILVFSIVGAVALAFVVRALDEPDFLRTAKMRAALAGKKACNTTALHLLNLADKAEGLYEQERL